jgi:hypothetical protein
MKPRKIKKAPIKIGHKYFFSVFRWYTTILAIKAKIRLPTVALPIP